MVTASLMPCLCWMMKVHWTQREFLFPKLNNCWSITRSHHKHSTLSFGTSLFWPTPADRISAQTWHLSFGTSLFWPTPADSISTQTWHLIVWYFIILTYSWRSHLCTNTAPCCLALPYSDLLLISHLCANTAPHCLALRCLVLHYSDLLPPFWESTIDSWVVLQWWWSSFCLMEMNKNC